MPGSWVTRMIVWPSSRLSVFNRSITWAAISLSKFPVGSSAQTIAGRATSARAIVTRCCSPPESSFGRWPPRAARPTRSSISSARRRASRGAVPTSSSGSSTFSAAVKTGMRLNAWKTKPMVRARCSVRLASGIANRSTPPSQTRPPSRSSRPDRQFSRVVFPEPDGPITATSSPAATSMSSPRNASTTTESER